MKKLALFVAFAGFAAAQVYTQSLVCPATCQAANSSVPIQNGDVRVEFLLQDWATTVDNSVLLGSNFDGLSIKYQTSGNRLEMFWTQGNLGAPSPCRGAPPLIVLSQFSVKAAYIRFQRTLVGGAGIPANSTLLEAWDSNGTPMEIAGGGALCTYISPLTTGYSTGASAGSSGSSVSTTFGFVGAYNTLVSRGSQMPVTSPAGVYASGCVFLWKFDTNTNDFCGSNMYPGTLTGAAASYVSTGTLQNLVVSRPQFSPTSYTDGITLDTGVANTLTGAESFSQASGSSVPSTFAWDQNLASSGCTRAEVISFSPGNAVTQAITPTLFGEICPRLAVTDTNGNMATATLKTGAVDQDANGIVTHSEDAKIEAIFGKTIAFGKNPWGYQDKQAKVMVDAQIPRQAVVNDFGWTTTGIGTISYIFAGKGPGPGPACTTLNGPINTTVTAITVTDASCLSLAGLPGEPTWIIIGTSLTDFEVVRICSRSGNVLTVCYDGRGVAGGTDTIGGYAFSKVASAWPTLTEVGEMRIQGTSTKFITDLNRPVCPAGAPGPQGQVMYSTGTVTLGASSTTITGSGTTWSIANGVSIGGFIRVEATHGLGSAFIYWARITAFTATSITVNRPAPVDVDVTAFSYKITAPPTAFTATGIAMSVSLEFTVDGHTERALQNGMGCESETAMFAVAAHDVAGIDGTLMGPLKYSYKVFLSEISNNGTPDPNFYGTGLAAREFYYRSGYGPALDLANSIDEYWVRDPQIGGGYLGSPPLSLGGGVIGAMADLILNPGTTLLTWPNVEQFAVRGSIGAQACNSTDTRDGGYDTAWLTMAANWDTNATNRAIYKTSLGTVLTRDQTCKRNSADGYTGAEVNSFSNSFVFSPAGSGTPAVITLTNGSAAVTGTGFTQGLAGSYPNYSGSVNGYCWGVDIVNIHVTNGSSTFTVNSGTLTQQTMIYFADSNNKVGVFEYLLGSPNQLSGVWSGLTGDVSAMSTGGGQISLGGQRVGGYGGILAQTTPTSPPADTVANNQALEKVWACKYNSSTSLTLFRNWDGTSTSGLTGGLNYYISYYNIGTFGQQPFMYGVKTNQVNWATKNDNSTIASGYAAIAPLMGAWYNANAWDYSNANHGTFFNVVAQACGSANDVPAGLFFSIHGQLGCGPMGLASGAAAQARVNSVEGGAAMIQYYLAQCAIGSAQCLAARSTVDTFYGAIFGSVSYCAAAVLSTCDGTIASQLADSDMASAKWPGFFYGMGGLFSNSWPAIRLGVVLPTITTTCPLPGGTQNVPYSQTLLASGSTPLTWTISSGSLPTGLSLVVDTITGTPSLSGVSTFGIQVSNSAGNSTNGPLSCGITVAGPLGAGGFRVGGNISSGGNIRR